MSMSAASSSAAFDELFQLNPRAVSTVERIKADPSCPVVIVDDFYLDPDRIRALALTSRYDVSYFGTKDENGHIAPIQPVPHLKDCLQALTPVPGHTLVSRFQYNAADHAGFYAHWDQTAVSGLVYLSPVKESGVNGTAFCQHIRTGLYDASEARIKGVAQALGMQPGDVLKLLKKDAGEEDKWRTVFLPEYRFNRAVFFPGRLLHRIGSFWGKDFRDARLVHGFFLM